MEMKPTNGTATLKERLEDPATAATLHRLLDQLDAFEQGLNMLLTWTRQAPGFAAMTADMVDEQARRARASGVDIEQRLDAATEVLEKLTRPETLRLVSSLVDLAEEAPGFVAMLADMFDAFARKAQADGLDIEKGLSRGVRAAITFGATMGPQQLEHIEALLTSTVLDPDAIDLVGDAGQALVRSRQQEPPQLGLLGLFRALRDPDVARALGFLVQFAQHFGRALDGRSSNLLKSA